MTGRWRLFPSAPPDGSGLVQTVAGLGETAELLSLAGGGFRDSTRIALGCPRMWKDICLSNRDNLLTMLDMFADRLSEVRQLVAQADAAGLLAYFAAAREVRQQVPLRGKGLLPLLYNLFVFVPDRPGLIGEVTGLLGEGGNIAEVNYPGARKTGGPLRWVVTAAQGMRPEILQTAGPRGAAGIRMRVTISAQDPGDSAVPGDKSISHRAAILGALAEGNYH